MPVVFETVLLPAPQLPVVSTNASANLSGKSLGSAAGGAIATIAGGAGTKKGLGVVLYTNDYYDSTFPFLNFYKFSSTNNTSANGIAWETAPANCSGDLKLDANGYVTSLTGYSGAVYSSVSVYTMMHVGTGPGATSLIPPGPYRVKVTGKGVINFAGGLVTSLSSVSPGTSTISGTVLDTTGTVGETTVTINAVDGNNGIVTTITSIPDPVNYPRNMSLVQVANAAAYDAGAIFHPTFLAALANFDEIRVKDWNRTDICPQGVMFQQTLPIGTTTATLRFYNWSLSTPAWQNRLWARPSGTYLFTFMSGEQQPATCVWNSSTVNFPALTKVSTDPGNNYEPHAYYPSTPTWAARPMFSNFSWNTDRGMPYDVSMALANILNGGAGVNLQLSYPATIIHPAGPDMAFVNGIANIAHDGTDATVPGFTGILQKVIPEFSNECWNTSYPSLKYLSHVGNLYMPSAAGTEDQQKSAEMRGAMQATIGDAWYSIFGAAGFAQHVIVPVGGQTAWTAGGGASSWGLWYTKPALDTPHWTSAAKNHHIGAIIFAPYIGFYANVNLADQTTILATADPVHTWFGLAYTNNFEGNIYTSVDTAGWAGIAKNTFTGLMAGLASYGLPIRCYEAGTDFFCHGMSAGWINLARLAHFDPRIEFIFYDANNAMYSTYGYPAANGQKGLLQTMADLGVQHMDFYGFCTGSFSDYGEWGLIETTLQPVIPLASAPLKYQAAQKFILGL